MSPLWMCILAQRTAHRIHGKSEYRLSETERRQREEKGVVISKSMMA